MRNALLLIVAVLILPIWMPIALIAGWFYTFDKDAAEEEMK